MNQAGLAECIVRAVQACHPYIQPVLYERYLLNGDMPDPILIFDLIV
jgi:actin-related protein 6